MKRKVLEQSDPLALRQRAEAIHLERADPKSKGPGALSVEEVGATLHELQVHQIELEMQNDELRLAQEKLDAIRARYFDLYDLAPVGYCTLSAEGLVLEANATMLRLLDRARNDVVARPITQFFLAEDQDIYYLHRRRFVDSRGPHSCDLRMVRKDGGELWVQVTAVAVPGPFLDADATGSDQAVIRLVVSDIGEIKRAEAEKNELATQLHQAAKLKATGLLSAGIAQDFNNLLKVILSNVGLGGMVAQKHPEVLRFFGAIEGAALKATDLTRQLLAYAGKAKWNVEDVDINIVAREAAGVLAVALPTNLTLTCELADRVPFWRGDSTQISQILLNLVMNAFESFPVGRPGRITLRTSALGVQQVEPGRGTWVLPVPAGRYAMVEVQDTGSGMTAATLEQAFDPFFTTKLEGRGLGLAVVHGILSAHGGGLSVHSLPGQGTTFQVYLPALAAPRMEAILEGAPAWRGTGVVLVVDGDGQRRNTARCLLETLGFNVLEARGGLEALELFRKVHEGLALVLLDRDLQGSSARDACQWMRDLDAKVPVILVSHHSKLETAPWVKDLAAVLGKPLRPAELVAALQRTLS